MSSYRDPNTLRTIETFASAAAWAARDGNLTAEILEEAHLKAFKAIDAPLAPVAAARRSSPAAWTTRPGRTFRDRLLDCTVEQMRACAEKYLVGQTPALAIVGAPANAEAMREAGYDILDARAGERHLMGIIFFVKERAQKDAAVGRSFTGCSLRDTRAQSDPPRTARTHTAEYVVVFNSLLT